MELKIMVTGRMGSIVKDVSEHLMHERGYPVITCAPKKSELLSAALSEMPQVVILCLRNESSETVRNFDILTELMKTGDPSFIVIANEEDAEVFRQSTGLPLATILSRPVSFASLYYALNEIAAAWRQEEEKLRASLEEFVNPNASLKYPRRHILVVDDDPEQLLQIREHLREFYDVTLVGSGKKMFKYLEKSKPDLILLDYMMPELDGAGVLEQLRGNEEFKDIPVIFLTGVSERETVQKIILELKPEGFVLKPTKKSELVARIIEVLG